MFVDASVIVAILNEEPGAEELENRLAAATRPLYVPTRPLRGSSRSRASSG